MYHSVRMAMSPIVAWFCVPKFSIKSFYYYYLFILKVRFQEFERVLDRLKDI